MPDAPNPVPQGLLVRDLHGLLWSKSLSVVGRDLGWPVADLAEFCAYAGIPLPSPAYWRNKRAGKRVHRRWIPKGLDPSEKVAFLVEKRRRGESAIPAIAPEQDIEDLIDVISRLEIEVAPADSTRRLHQVVAATRRLMRKQARDEWPTRFNRIRRRGQFEEPVFIAEVGRLSVGRAAQLLDALVRAVLDLGGGIDVGRGDVAAVALLGELHRFRLRERLQRQRSVTEDGAAKERWLPTGQLELHLELWPSGDVVTKWSDGSAGSLESQLRQVLVALVRQVQVTRAKNNEVRRAEEQRRLAREERRRRAEDVERAKHRVGVLRECAERHGASVTMRRLLSACRSDGPLPIDVEQWLVLAERAAHELDPISGGVAALRDQVEKQIDEKMRGWHYYDWQY